MLTATKEGEAKAAEAKWKQEVFRSEAVTKAQQEKDVAEMQGKQRLAVAELATKAAEQTKQTEILLGEGEAQRRQLVMTADGALEKKLAAYVEVNKMYAEALGAYKGAWVPGIVMGGGGSSGSPQVSGPADLITLLTAKAAKDLALDLAVTSGSGTHPMVPTPVKK